MTSGDLAAFAALALAAAVLAAPWLPEHPRPNRARRRKPAGGPCHRSAERADYLFPEEWRYPVPTLACARRALSYAAWPDNLYDAPRVVERLFKAHPEFRFDRKLQTQARRLLARHDRRYGAFERKAA